MDRPIEKNDVKMRQGLGAAALERQAGMTLTEIMVVVIIMALIATGVALAVLPRLKDAKIKATRSDVQVVQSAVTLWMAENNGCPTIDQLPLSHGARTKDAWDKDFVINCEGEEPSVASAGPDGEMGTEDDIH
jgi:general secretion pathway protein G